MRLKIAVLGSDARFFYLGQLLNGHEITDDLTEAELIITPWPAPADIPDNGTVVTCGPAHSPEWAVDLLQDEEYQREIAWMTAEGALASVMGENNMALCGAKCLVVGWGRIGKTLAVRLAALGADVTVLSRRGSVWNEVRAIGARWKRTDTAAEAIPGCKFVFSTPPSMIIDRFVMENADDDAVIIDLASPPYGVDIEAADELGLKARREPGLPGRYCPTNAGQAIYDAIIRHGLLKGVSEND